MNLYLAIKKSRHTKRRPAPADNGIAERFPQDQCCRSSTRGPLSHASLDRGSCRDRTDAWINQYNTERIHQGSVLRERTPGWYYLAGQGRSTYQKITGELI